MATLSQKTGKKFKAKISTFHLEILIRIFVGKLLERRAEGSLMLRILVQVEKNPAQLNSQSQREEQIVQQTIVAD